MKIFIYFLYLPVLPVVPVVPVYGTLVGTMTIVSELAF